MPIGSVETGTATSLRLSAKDASVEAKKVVDIATQKAEAMKPKANQIKYAKIGEPVFSCFSKAGKRITFAGGAYIVDKKSPISADTIESLQYFVDTGILTKTEG